MQLTTLAKSPHFYPQAILLIEQAFKYPSGQSFAVDFYPLIRKENWDHCYILIEEDRVLAHAGILLKKISIGTSIAFLGGIAVAPDLQGQGHFRKIFEPLLQKYQDHVAFFVLWSDLADLYKKFDFFQAGQCYQTGDSTFSPPPDYELSNLKNLGQKDVTQLKNLYRSHLCSTYISIKRSDRDWENLAKISSTSLYVKRSADRHIEAYFFVGKGADLTDIIHESVAIDPRLFSSYRLWSGIKPHSFVKSIYLGLFRTGSPELFRQFIQTYLHKQIQIESLSPSQIQFVHNQTKYSLPMQEFWPLLLGPGQAKEFEQVAKPLYFSGLDTI